MTTAADRPEPASHGLAGLDGLDAAPEPPPTTPPPGSGGLRLDTKAARIVREQIDRAGGREVCFLCAVTPERVIERPRAVARGNRNAVLAVAREAEHGSLLLHNHPSGLLEPSDADLAVAAHVWDQGLGTAITDNQATGLYVVVEPPRPKVLRPLPVDVLDSAIAAGGLLEGVHPRFEERAGQRRMLRLVAERYNEGGVAVVEAGTGTGKSLAYLLPAAVWALTNGERTVVSTNTINLQTQLDRKDLPLVARLVESLEPAAVGPDGGRPVHDPDRVGEVAVEGGGPPPFSWAVVKGRGNYISIRRARLALETAPSLFDDDRTEELEAILEWSERTDEGSIQDLPFIPSDDVWEEVQSDPDVCLRGKCPHFQRCFYQRSRRAAAGADVVVVNHHLLFTDLAVRRATGNWTRSAVLPAYRRLVLDEAHNLEDAATSHLGVRVTRRGMMRLLSRLDRNGKGIVTAVQEGLRGGGQRATLLRSRIEKRVRPAIDEARSTALGFVEALESAIPSDAREGIRIGEGEETVPEPLADPSVGPRFTRLVEVLTRLEEEIGGLRRGIDADEELAERLEGRLLDLVSAERRLGAQRYGLRLVLDPSEEEAAGHVRWLELGGRGRRRNLALAAAPVDLGPLLRDSLFQETKTVVLTSATLATRGRFDFLRGRVGLDLEGLETMERPPSVVEEIVPSPFDFARQVLFCVVTGLSKATSQERAFQVETARVAASLAEITDGGLFLLFTSYRALDQVARHLRESGASNRWPIFVHGEEDRARLLEGFTHSGRGILLGTSSFWEGVDVPGDPLRGLVIQKLPFRVPTEPVTAARVEAIEARGEDAFNRFMLPLAALRLKQGFGRLIRSVEDRGAVVLLDDRILRRRYGRYLRESLPEAPLARGPWDRLEPRLHAFYG